MVYGQKAIYPLFNIDEIKDDSSLKIKIEEDWHLVEGEIPG